MCKCNATLLPFITSLPPQTISISCICSIKPQANHTERLAGRRNPVCLIAPPSRRNLYIIIRIDLPTSRSHSSL
jgi:hypothetical protein